MKPGDKKEQLTIGLLSDLHFCDSDPFEERFFRNGKSKIGDCIHTFNRATVDFVIDLGDVIDKDFESFETILPYYKLFKKPVYHLVGNHDWDVEDHLKQKVGATLGYPDNLDRSFSAKGFRIILLNGNTISTYASAQGSEHYVLAEKWLNELERSNRLNAQFWNGGISAEQLTWLENELQKAAEQNQRALIFCHFPIFPHTKYNLLNAEDVLEAITRYPCLAAWISGHNHHGNYGIRNKTHFINLKGMVETAGTPAFSVLHIYSEQMILHGYGREQTRILNI